MKMLIIKISHNNKFPTSFSKHVLVPQYFLERKFASVTHKNDRFTEKICWSRNNKLYRESNVFGVHQEFYLVSHMKLPESDPFLPTRKCSLIQFNQIIGPAEDRVIFFKNSNGCHLINKSSCLVTGVNITWKISLTLFFCMYFIFCSLYRLMKTQHIYLCNFLKRESNSLFTIAQQI